jgi:hypothetical protein
MDELGEISLLDHDVGPELRLERLPGQDLAGCDEEQMKEVERLRRERHALLVPVEHHRRELEPERPEGEATVGGGRDGSTPGWYVPRGCNGCRPAVTGGAAPCRTCPFTELWCATRWGSSRGCTTAAPS